MRSLLGDRVDNFTTRRETVTVDRFERPEDFRDFFRDRYGPVMAVYRSVADDPDRVAALDDAVIELTRRHDRGSKRLVMDWEYLLVTAQVRDR